MLCQKAIHWQPREWAVGDGPGGTDRGRLHARHQPGRTIGDRPGMILAVYACAGRVITDPASGRELGRLGRENSGAGIRRAAAVLPSPHIRPNERVLRSAPAAFRRSAPRGPRHCRCRRDGRTHWCRTKLISGELVESLTGRAGRRRGPRMASRASTSRRRSPRQHAFGANRDVGERRRPHRICHYRVLDEVRNPARSHRCRDHRDPGVRAVPHRGRGPLRRTR